MTLDQYIGEYIKKFGGFPYFLIMGAKDEVVIEMIKEALETGEEIKPKEGMIY
jgi:hypothetical protein